MGTSKLLKIYLSEPSISRKVTIGYIVMGLVIGLSILVLVIVLCAITKYFKKKSGLKTVVPNDQIVTKVEPMF